MQKIGDRYLFVEDISQGSQGVISLVKDTKANNKLVVMKKIKPQEESQVDIEHSKQEVNLLKELHHPNVIQYYDMISEPDNFYIFLEYADAQDLSVYLKKHPKMETEEILHIFSQIIFGLAYIHSKNIIHRDLKCENIFLFKNKLVKIGDFGVSKMLSSGDQYTSTIIGSPFIFPIEFFVNHKYTFSADIWAAGCILFQMMTGKHPFISSTINELIGKILSQKFRFPPGCDKRLADLFLDMVNLEAKDRPTANDILEMPFINKHLPKLQKSISIDDYGINQFDIPEWVKNNKELALQNSEQLDNDTSSFNELIKSSFNNLNQRRDPVTTITTNLSSRKDKLIHECKAQMKEKYEIAYDFIKKNGIDKRDELCTILKTPFLYEKSIKKIEIILMIERFQYK